MAKPKTLKSWVSQLSYEFPINDIYEHTNVGTTLLTDRTGKTIKYNAICSKCGNQHSGIGPAPRKKEAINFVICPNCGTKGFLDSAHQTASDIVYAVASYDIPEEFGEDGVAYVIYGDYFQRSFNPLLHVGKNDFWDKSGKVIICPKKIYIQTGKMAREVKTRSRLQEVIYFLNQGSDKVFYADERAKAFAETYRFNQTKYGSAGMYHTDFSMFLIKKVEYSHDADVFAGFDIDWTVPSLVSTTIEKHSSDHIVWYGKSPKGDIIVRAWTGEIETRRAILSPEKCATFARIPWRTALWHAERWDFYSTVWVQTKEEVLALIKSSSLAYSGFIEAADLLGDFICEFKSGKTYICPTYLVNYAIAYSAVPVLESAAKCGLYSLVRYAALGSAMLVSDKSTNKLIAALGLSNSIFKYLRSIDKAPKNAESDMYLDFQVYNGIAQWRKMDNSVCVDDIRTIHQLLHKCGEQFNSAAFSVLSDISAIGFGRDSTPELRSLFSAHRIVSYVTQLVDVQCIDCYGALIEWRDYLNLLIQLEADMTDTSITFPLSLKLEHDRASYKFKAIEDQLIRKNFSKAAKTNEWLSYKNEKEDYVVLVPQSPEEMFEEHRVLGHCVHSYVKNVASRNTTVAFIRRSNRPNVPYCTIEVSNGSILQARGKGNRFPRDEALSGFVRRYAQTKALNISCSIG